MGDKNGSGGAFMAGFILGGLVGAAAALLLSPQPGKMTREQLVERTSGLQEQLGPLAERTAGVRERAGGLATKVQEQVGPLGEKTAGVRERAGELATKVQERGKILVEEMQAGEEGAEPTEEEAEPPEEAEQA